MPLHTPRWKLFVATYIGIAVPTILVQILGAAIYSGAQSDPEWKQAFVEFGIGGPLKKAVAPAGGFGSLCLVFAALSSVANNIPNNVCIPEVQGSSRRVHACHQLRGFDTRVGHMHLHFSGITLFYFPL
jgi:hypothetical protein